MAVPYNDDYVRREEEDGVEQEMHGRNQDVQAAEVPATGQQSRFLIACSVVGVVWFIVSLILFAYFSTEWCKTCQRELDLCSTKLSEEDYKTCINEWKTCENKLKTRDDELKTRDDELKTRVDELKTCNTELSKAQTEVKTCHSEMAQLYRKEGEWKICQNELGKCKRLLSKAQREVKTCDRKEGVCSIWQNELGECKRQVNHYLKERDSSNDENSELKSQLSSCETGRLHGYILIAIPTIIIFCCFFNRGPKPGPNSDLRKIDRAVS